MEKKDLYPTDEQIILWGNLVDPDYDYDLTLGQAGKFAKLAVDNAVKKIVKELTRKNKFPQCKGLVLTVEDWQALKKLTEE